MSLTLSGNGITSANIVDGTITNTDINSTSTGLDDVSGVARATSGLLFNGDTAAANALDDYEEGTWTPAPNSGSFSTSGGKYTKIGRVIHLSFDFIVGTGGGNNIALPITGAVTNASTPYTHNQDFPAGRTYPTSVVAGSTMYFRTNGDNIAWSAMSFTAGAVITGNITYSI